MSVLLDARVGDRYRWPELDDPILRVLESALVRDSAARPKASALRDRLRGIAD